ncbi:unnamed protein product [Adineta ricciae]|uniref:Uncharacterized protein n=1 Tax=Adineta ricciae TaxID=249248 RepID=A0A815UH66_ADIRI|nr:unnamed protein product [Adineta ricciae]CAF1516116.1 unnamed protein product [Adineta ricciae]
MENQSNANQCLPSSDDKEKSVANTSSALKDICNIKMESESYRTYSNTTDLKSLTSRKRSVDDVCGSETDGENQIDIPHLKRLCVDLQARVARLETTWMPSAEHNEIVQHTLNDMLTCVDHRIAVPHNNNNDMANAMQILNISSIEMMKLNKRTATGTARSIIKFKVPDPPVDFRLPNVDKENRSEASTKALARTNDVLAKNVFTNCCESDCLHELYCIAEGM